MTFFNRHLDDTALRMLAFHAVAGSPGQAAHLRDCEQCRARQTSLARELDAVRFDASAAADAQFSAADLEHQRRAILGRLNRSGRAARVLTFPGHEGTASAPRADRRWLAAAAAAGLVLGALAGQLPHRFAGAPATQSASLGVAQPASAPVQAVDTRGGDDELLSEVDAALDGPARSELAALDALTPIHYEFR